MKLFRPICIALAGVVADHEGSLDFILSQPTFIALDRLGKTGHITNGTASRMSKGGAT
jgi:hypothetical protein